MTMIERIKELFTACYDPITDTIHNCKPDTNAWHHEDRHRQQMKGGVIPLCYTYHICILTVLIFVFSINSGRPLYIMLSILMMLLYLYPEFDAHIYAYKKMKGERIK